MAGDLSGTITTGGTAQTLIAASGIRSLVGWAVYNPDPSNDLWVSDDGVAAPNTAGSIRVPANGGGYETPPGYTPNAAVSIYGAVTGQQFTAKDW